jgi:hypothetical protein
MRTQSLTVSHMVPQCQFIMPHVMQPQVVRSCRPRADSLADASALPDEMMPHVTQAQVVCYRIGSQMKPSVPGFGPEPAHGALSCLTAALFQCCPVTVNQTHGCHVTLLPCLTSAFSLSTTLTADAALCHYCSVSLLPCLTAALSMSITLPCLTSLSHDPCFSVGVLRAEGISMFSPTHTGSPKQPSYGDELMLGGRSEGTSTPWLTL